MKNVLKAVEKADLTGYKSLYQDDNILEVSEDIRIYIIKSVKSLQSFISNKY